MPAIVLTLTVNDLPQVLAAYDHIRLYRSTTGKDGEFLPITDAATDVPLLPGVTSYTYEDKNGAADFWYRSQFVNQITISASPTSEAFSTGLEPALAIMSVQDLKENYLFGLDLTDSKGDPIPDSFFVRYIKSAVAAVETMLDITLAPTVVLAETHDYIQREADQFFYTNLHKRPVNRVTSFRLHVPGGTPIVFPPNWYETQALAGVVEVVPKGSVTLQPSIGYSPYFSPMFMSATRRRIPNALVVDYVAGFAPGEVPSDILEFIGKQAAMGPLRTVGNLLLGAGIAGQSIGIDGLSQSVSLTKQGNGAFAAMVSDYQQDLLQLRQQLRGKYHGVSVRMA